MPRQQNKRPILPGKWSQKRIVYTDSDSDCELESVDCKWSKKRVVVCEESDVESESSRSELESAKTAPLKRATPAWVNELIKAEELSSLSEDSEDSDASSLYALPKKTARISFGGYKGAQRRNCVKTTASASSGRRAGTRQRRRRPTGPRCHCMILRSMVRKPPLQDAALRTHPMWLRRIVRGKWLVNS